MKYRNFTRLGADYPNEKAIPDYLQVKPRLVNYFEFLLLATSIFTTIGGIISAVLHEISITLCLFSGFSLLGLTGAFVLSQDSIHHRTAIIFSSLLFVTAIFTVVHFDLDTKLYLAVVIALIIIWLCF